MRYFLYESDGTLRRISQRIVWDLVLGRDCLPQYADQNLRMLSVYLALDDGRPAQISGQEAEILHFDGAGGIRQGLANSAAWAGATNEALQEAESTGPVIDIVPRVERRRWGRENRWQPTDAEITEIVHATD
jgi:hypothetical protein